MELGLGYLKHTDITLQLADRSITKPRGILEDVLVKVNDLHYLVDFKVLDMEAPKQLNHTPIILGRPFLATAKGRIDCESGNIEMASGDKTNRFNIFEVSKKNKIKCGSMEELDRIEEVMAIHTLHNLLMANST